VAQLVEAVRYKAEGRGFNYRWGHGDFSLAESFWPHYGTWESTQPLTEMSTLSTSWEVKTVGA
jgi:hypothetical protein